MYPVERYPNISDHGLIGDLQTAALVSTDGTVTWYCCPRFDSPSVFASLLDADKGGFFRASPDRDDYVSKQLYLPDTAVLITRFMTPDGVGEIHLMRETVSFWRNWLHGSTYQGRWREMVGRSALTLKLMTYAPTGAPVAAPTAALPEQVGGERNWDYRYTWIRDGSFSIYALLGLGFTEEAVAFGDWLCEHWDQPDEGIWETRGGRKDFVYGRIQTWVALDRAIKLATSRARPADLQRWRTERDAVYNQVFEKGWNPKIGGFTQYYGSEVLDSALLMMPQQGLIAPRDPLWLSTLAAIDRELVSDSLVYRYNPSASPDGLAGHEGTFSLCTFWYVNALARSGRLNDAQLTFEKMHTYANHLGLYSEEIGSTGEQLGNFPQAFSHLALISAAVNLDHQLDHGAGSMPMTTGNTPVTGA